jgi:sulfate permease, SulP family
MPVVDVTAARMLTQLTADLGRQQVPLVVARDVGQVRDMLALADQPGGAPEYYPSVQDAVNAVRPAPSAMPGQEG